jgi:hypothetical protein
MKQRTMPDETCFVTSIGRMEFILGGDSCSGIQDRIGVHVDSGPAHAGIAIVEAAEVYRARIEKTPFEQAALGQFNGGIPQPCRIGLVGLSDRGQINDRIDALSNALDERRTIVDVAVLAARIRIESVGMDDSGTAFDARYPFTNDLTCENRDSRLKLAVSTRRSTPLRSKSFSPCSPPAAQSILKLTQKRAHFDKC